MPRFAKSPRPLTLLIAAAFCLAGATAWADPPASTPEKSEKPQAQSGSKKPNKEKAKPDQQEITEEDVNAADSLLGDGDKLAEKKKYDDALLEYKRAYEQIVPMLRGLPFRSPVEPKLMSRTELQQYMQQEMEKEVDKDEQRLLAATLAAFGFAREAIDVEKLLVNLYTEEVAGFYDPTNQKMFLIHEQAKESKPKGLFELLLGSEQEFDTGQQKSTLAHEMTHALADQHFGLDAMHQATKHDDDMALALSALIEGEAMIVMFEEMYREGLPSGQVLSMAPARMDLLFGVMKMVMPFSSGKTFSSSPRIFQESLIFPYHKGSVFLLHLTNKSGWKQVNRAFRNPPVSTEQILHPEKFLGKDRDDPVIVSIPDLSADLPGWESVGQNVLGEFQLSVLLEKTAGGKRAAAGWDGDLYRIYERDGKYGLVWMSVWDDEAQAAEFADVYATFARREKVLRALPEEKDENGKPKPKPALTEFLTGEKIDDGKLRQASVDDRVFRIEQRGDRVAVIEGFSAAETEALTPHAFDLTIKPKRYEKVAKKKPETVDGKPDSPKNPTSENKPK